MKQNSATWISIAGIIIVLAAAIWWYSSNGQMQAVTASTDGTELAEGSNGTAGAVTTDTGITGSVKPTETPLVNPLGSAAGGVVDARSMTVAQVVANLSGTSQFAGLFADYGATQVSGSGKFTVFVPTDGALSQLTKGTVANLSTTEKARLIKNHIIVGRAVDTDGMIAGSVQSASGDPLNFSYSSQKLPMVGNAIIITQFNAKNGVVYTIDNVLLPPKK